MELPGYHSTAPILRSLSCPLAPDQLPVPAVPAGSALGRGCTITKDSQSQWAKRKRLGPGEHDMFRQHGVF